MAILVDEARWPWRGTVWCHLVTDSHLEELHDFARRLGCRRIGFQGDHYDIDVDTRRLAIAAGAEPTSSRELVRRLRAAGLRLRPSQFPKWELVDRWEGPLGGAEIERRLRRSSPVPPRMLDVVAPALACADGAFVVRRRTATAADLAVVVHGVADPPGLREEPTRGIYCRVDHRGAWSIEVTSTPLLPSQ